MKFYILLVLAVILANVISMLLTFGIGFLYIFIKRKLDYKKFLMEVADNDRD